VLGNPIAEEMEDIKPVKIMESTLRIQLGDNYYPMIMCYICPICKEPLMVYWKLNGKPRVTNRIVGRGLRDSGFGAYRFFEEENGQGFEYDPEKDPKKRHYHQKRSEYAWSDNIIQSWFIFMELNPLVTVNKLLNLMINRGEFEKLFPENHPFITEQNLALEFIEAMRSKPDYFHVIHDIVKHGKPIFYLDIIRWQQQFSSWDRSEYAGIREALNIFDRSLLKRLNYGEKGPYIHEHYLTEQKEEDTY
jgi:hypothetical protein